MLVKCHWSALAPACNFSCILQQFPAVMQLTDGSQYPASCTRERISSLRGSHISDIRQHQSELLSPHQAVGHACGHKRPLGQETETSDRDEARRRTRRGLFEEEGGPRQTALTSLGPRMPPAMPPAPLQTPLSAPAVTPAKSVTNRAPQQTTPLPNATPSQTPAAKQAHSSWSQLLGRSAEVMHGRLADYNLPPDTSAIGQHLVQLELQLQTLLGVRPPEDGPDAVCWVDLTMLLHADGVKCFCISYGDVEGVQMLLGLSQLVCNWCHSPQSQYCTDENNKFFHSRNASACLMRRLIAASRMRLHLQAQQPLLEALADVVCVLQQRFADKMPAGLYTWELRPLIQQALTVARHWQSRAGLQKADRAVQMLQAMSSKVAQLPYGSSGVGLADLVQQLMNEYHPQVELVQERLQQHIQHLLKFGRNNYDPLQYNAVVADINRPLLINAGPGSGKTTVMALRALYIIGVMRQRHCNTPGYGRGFDDVVALTFSRRAQQHMEKTLDGLCVRVAHNHTFDGLWLRMANDCNRLRAKPAVKVIGQEEVRSFLSDQIQHHMQQLYFFGRCRCCPEGADWRDLRDSFSELLTHHLQQGFVTRTRLGIYTMKHVWDEAAARQEIVEAFLTDQRVKYELSRTELPVSSRDLRAAVLPSIRALIDGLQEDDAIVWELLGHATRIWHLATAQLPCTDAALLQAAHRIFGYWSSRQAWLLDEFQDVAHAQYRLLHALTHPFTPTRPFQRVTIVGDGDQAIYDWRGADVHLFEAQFEKDYTAVQRLAMITNYRSTPSIVNHSSALIARNYCNPIRGSCVPKALRAAPGTEDQRAVQFVRYKTKKAQANHILSCVNWWHEHGTWRDRGGVQRGPGVPYSQMRILARARWQLLHLKGALSRGGLKPYVVLAGDNANLDDESSDAEDEELLASQVSGASRDKLVLSSVHAVKGLEFVVCFVVGLDTKAWRYLPYASNGPDLQQTRESRNVAYVAMTRAERVLYLSHVGSPADANSFFSEAMLPGDAVTEF